MKITAALLLLISLFCASGARGQSSVRVVVYPGTELLQVIHLLSDTAQMAKSTYNADVVRYFHAYKQHAAVRRARTLPHISCDFPVRLSWAFYHFPDLKLAMMKPVHMDGYETEGSLPQLQAYFQECARFYRDSRFWQFYKAHEPEYRRWVASFEQHLYRDGMIAALDEFYRLKRDKPIVFTLGALNCGSYAMSDLRGINPNLPNQITIMVAYSQMAENTDSVIKPPTFHAPIQASQLIWHELGHAYLGELFSKYQQEIQSLAYLMQQDANIKQRAEMRGGWANYLNENTTQAVTSLLRIRTGKVSRETELATSPDEFYLLYAEMLGIIERQYYGNSQYRDFGQFFPVLLAELGRNHPKQ